MIKFPSLLAVLGELPSIWRTVVSDVQAARAATSDGGATVTAAELESIAADVGLKLGERLVSLLFRANGVGND